MRESLLRHNGSNLFEVVSFVVAHKLSHPLTQGPHLGPLQRNMINVVNILHNVNANLLEDLTLPSTGLRISDWVPKFLHPLSVNQRFLMLDVSNGSPQGRVHGAGAWQRKSEKGEENTFPTSESIVVALGSIGSESPV